MTNYCTLFDSGYLDKGCIMIESLLRVSKDAHIYVLAFDDKCYEVLSDINYENTTVISLQEFESERILKFKANRSHRSYCWSCTPFLIKHVLEHYDAENCTYIDADMLFYSNPNVLVDDVRNDGCDVGIVEHRFGEGTIQEEQVRIAGKYCVEFNTFIKNDNSLKVLNWWADKYEECCTDDTSQSQNGMFGDQMYLNDWLDRFQNIYVMKNHGGGMAPWNVYRYRLEKYEADTNSINFSDTQSQWTGDLVFYHFHDIDLFSDNKANINVYGRYGKSEAPDSKLISIIYNDYLARLKAWRQELGGKYNITWRKLDDSKSHISSLYPNAFSKLRHLGSYKNKIKNMISY